MIGPAKSDDSRKKLNRRAVLLTGIQVGFIGILGWQMRRISVEQNQAYKLLADDNRVNIRLIPPKRGLLFDRLAKPLAYNEPSYKIDMVREQSDDPEAVLRRLARLVPISEEDIVARLEEMNKRRGFVPITVARDLHWEQIAAVSVNAPVLPGIIARLGYYRNYPQAANFAHIVGFVGPVSDFNLNQTDDNDPLLLIPRFQIGKDGIEKRIEKPLRGKAGVKRIEVNSIGRVIRTLSREPSQAGVTAQLSVDHRLQRYVSERLGKISASVVVMDIRNGDLLAMVSNPAFDPNKFVRGISVKDWKSLNENKFKPMLNKAVTGLYPPGSTFKMVTALAALKSGVIKHSDRVHCGGFVEVSGRRFHCWRHGGHGHMNLHTGIRESCDVYFYELAIKVGIEKISAMANILGIGVKHDLELPAVRKGLTPTKDWKKQRRQEEWLIGDTLNSSIGQGFVLASPLQLAIMTARIGSGRQISPRLVNAIDNHPQPVNGHGAIDVDPAHLKAIRDAMFAVVNDPKGTAKGSAIRKKGWEMAGKTGTSQVRFISQEERDNGVIENKDLPWERRDHALFVAYAPADRPRFALSVVIEHGGSGSKTAAPIARDIMRATLELGEDMEYRALPTNTRTNQAEEDDQS